MSEHELPDVGAFGAAFDDFVRAMTEVARRGESPLAARLREHLGADPGELPSTVAEFSPADHANLQLGLDALAGDAEILGFSTPNLGFHAVGLSELVSEYGFGAMIRPGPVQYTDVEVGDGRVVQCVSTGVYLASHEAEPLVLVLARGQTESGATILRVEGVGSQGGVVPAFLHDLRAAMREIEQALAIARDLAPATVVLEDIDLVAAERTMPFADRGVLFELLNQTEGLAEDEDLLFVLTTNRPDILEPALATRPGRIDLALEIPLPDTAARHRLLDLYAAGIELDDEARRVIVERTERSPGAFFRELVRQAVLRAALDDRAAPQAADLVAALDELLDDRATLTRRLLGQPGDDGGSGSPGPAYGSMVSALGAAGLPMPELHEPEE